MATGLDLLRNSVSRWMITLLWLHVPLAGLAASAAGNGVWAPVLATAICAGVASACWMQSTSGKVTRLTIAVAYVGIVSILLAACRGAHLQIDMHMYYFAAMAILAAYCDRDVILTAAGVTAVHHLGLNFLCPALVFPDGTSLPRVLLHAVIVVAEAAALVWMAHHVVKLFEEATRNVDAAVAATEKLKATEARAAVARAEIEAEREAARSAAEAAARSQAQVVEELAAALARLAKGDLRTRIESFFPPEYKTLRMDFNQAAEQLGAAMREMLEHTVEITAESGRITNVTHQLAERTGQQTATLRQTAACMGEVNRAVKDAASCTGRAQALATAAHGDTDRSGSVVAEAVAAMNAIDASSRQIGNIIGVIDEIAFQTNLLALNAGVEAARAGDAGRGFAVVATEVRALAQRSADAAKEIKTLIAASEQQVRGGVERVAETGDVLVRLASQVGDINQEVGAISAATQRQAQALGEVDTALARMEQATQQTATMVEAANAASQDLAGDVEQMRTVSARFQVAEAERVAPSVRHYALMES